MRSLGMDMKSLLLLLSKYVVDANGRHKKNNYKLIVKAIFELF
jgi:hypothetical protein